jgi:membrane-bound metal-dependent hydrolase YbcI (DUF457 family)
MSSHLRHDLSTGPQIVPSPIGHALGAVAAGWAIARPATPRRRLAIQVAILATLGLAADFDLLIGRHSRETHSIGAAVIVASSAALWRWPIAGGRSRIWLAAFAAWLTHPLFDIVTEDTSVPHGVMLLWPLDGGHWHAGWTVFDSIYRNWRDAGFFTHNLLAMLRELAIVGPIAIIVWKWRRKKSSFAS